MYMTSAQPRSKAPILWATEAIAFLGLDRLGLARPELALYRLIKKGALKPRKILGKLAFSQAELDRVAANGDEPIKGRPRQL